MSRAGDDIGKDGLTRRDRDIIREVLARYPEVRRVTLFGSRAMGTFSQGSDIDLALEGPGLSASTLSRIAAELEDSDLPYKVDLLLRDRELEPEVEAHIRRHGKPFGWEETTLGELAEIFDGPHATPPKTNHGPIFLGISNLAKGRLDLSDAEHLSEEDFTRWTRRVKPRPGDVVFSYETRLGEAALVPQSLRCCLGRRMGLLRARAGRIDDRFLLYAYLGPQFQETLRSRTIHGSTVDRIPLSDLPEFAIWIPSDIAAQRAIAGVLGALDDKIEHNRRTARALERLARTIFRAWFVDFEPVKAKAAGATSFPSMPRATFDALPARLVESDIGLLPEGWQVKSLSQTASLTMGQSPSSEYYNREGNGLPFHQGVTDYGFRFPTHRVYCTAEGRLAAPGDVLLSVRAPVGRINVADRRLVLGRGLAGIRRHNDRQSFLLYQLRHMFAEEDAIGDGTIYKAVTKQLLANMHLLAPSDKVEQAFDDLARPLDDLIAASEVETRKLVEMRDYLLPKLLSGEARVRESEQTVAELQ